MGDIPPKVDTDVVPGDRVAVRHQPGLQPGDVCVAFKQGRVPCISDHRQRDAAGHEQRQPAAPATPAGAAAAGWVGLDVEHAAARGTPRQRYR